MGAYANVCGDSNTTASKTKGNTEETFTVSVGEHNQKAAGQSPTTHSRREPEKV